jgi:type IV secretion system protein TrbE
MLLWGLITFTLVLHLVFTLTPLRKLVSFDEHVEVTERLPHFLPWYGLIGSSPGLVLQKAEYVQKSYAFRGPDLASAGMNDLVRLSARVNAVLKRGGPGWAFFVEAQRLEAQEYPSASWPDPATWIVDRERRQRVLERSTPLYESFYFLTFVWKLPAETHKKLTRLFYEDSEGDVEVADTSRDIDFFLRSLEEMTDLLVADGGLKELIELDDDQTVTFLHSTISRNRQPVISPEAGLFLDAYLPDQALTCGETPMLGEWYMPVAVITQFLTPSTRPAMLAQLDGLGLEYRLVWRWSRMEKDEATKELEEYERSNWSKRIGVKRMLRQQASGQATALIRTSAIAKAHDARAALEELGADLVSYGKLTCTIVTWHTDYGKARANIRAIKQVIQSNGLIVRDETINSLEALLGSLPGKLNANVRDYNISSITLAHIIPATAVWSGEEENEHIVKVTGQREAHVYCIDGTNRFRFNSNVGDLGHQLTIGPSRSGKSVWLITQGLQWFRYFGARVVMFDKDRSSRAATMAVQGNYYEPGRHDAPVAFQPLARIDQPAERAWASEFIVSLLSAQGYQATPATKETIDHALEVLAQKPARSRRLFHFADQLGDPQLTQVLRPYTAAGHYGQIFDGDHEDIQTARWTTIEMGHLMSMGDAVIVPALAYLFHRIEAAFDGSLTLLILDEAWLFLDHPVFRNRIKNWLKTLAKKNVYVIFATQEVADAVNSPIMPTILAECQTRIVLPDPQASALADGYRRLQLTDAEIALLEQLEPKSQYFYTSPRGRRVFSLDHGPVGLAFTAMASPADQAVLDEIAVAVPPQHHAEMILRHRGLTEAADLVAAAAASGAEQFYS